jgi:secondary thiamine-phosphate synthase enzyme
MAGAKPPMKIYNEQIALQSQKPREVLNITTQVKAAIEKSGLREGVAVVSLLHANTAIVVGDESLRVDDLASWLADSSGSDPAASVRPAGMLGALLQHQIVVPFTEGRLDLGLKQSILFVELDGVRPRRIVVKILGE